MPFEWIAREQKAILGGGGAHIQSCRARSTVLSHQLLIFEWQSQKNQSRKSQQVVTHLSEQTGSEPKVVKAVLAALEKTVLGSVAKKGLGEFTLPGLLKVGVQKVEAKKRRKGIDPFTKIERWFEAQPATVRIEVRALKKLMDAAL